MSPYGENLFPSTMMCCGRVFKPSIARCMARMDALSMFIRSISSAVAMPTAHAMAVDSMIGRSNSRWRSVSCLESFSRGVVEVFGEYYGGGIHRSGKAASSGFVASGFKESRGVTRGQGR